MAGPWWRRAGGSTANQIAAGNVYNPYTGQYAPRGVQAVRYGLGAGQQLGGPVGTIAGMIGNWIYSRNNPQARAFDAGIQGWKGITQDFRRNQANMLEGLNRDARAQLTNPPISLTPMNPNTSQRARTIDSGRTDVGYAQLPNYGGQRPQSPGPTRMPIPKPDHRGLSNYSAPQGPIGSAAVNNFTSRNPYSTSITGSGVQDYMLAHNQGQGGGQSYLDELLRRVRVN